MTGKKCRIFSNGLSKRLAEGAEGTVRRVEENDGQCIWINIKAFPPKTGLDIKCFMELSGTYPERNE